MKKSISIILVLTLILSFALTGCGDTKKAANDSTTVKQDTSDKKDDKVQKEDTKKDDTKKEEGLKPVELTWYYVGNGQQEDVALVEEEANKYMKDKINATIKLNCFDWGSYEEKMGTMIAAGEEFDICFTCSWSNDYRQQSIKGAYIPLNDMWDKYAPKTKAMLGEDFLSGSRINGKNYAIPANKEKAHQNGFILRKDIVDKYNIDLTKITSLESIEPILKLIKEKEPDMYPLEATAGDCPDMLVEFDKLIGGCSADGLYIDSEDMKVINIFDTPEFRQYFKTMRKYYNEGYVRKDASTVTDFNADESAGKIFAAVKGVKPGKDAEMTNATGQPWIQVTVNPPVMSNFETMGSMMAISRTSKNPERALMFLEMFNSDEYMNNLINYGVENVHYKKVSDNVIEPATDNKKYNPGTTWMFGNVFINYLWSNEDPDKWNNFKKFNESAIPTKTLGFMFDPKPVKNELAACKAVMDEFYPGLKTGSLDPEEYLPKFLDALKDANIEKVQSEEQRQLDEWLASK